MDNETWKDIPGYEGLYEINIFGDVRICSTQKIRLVHTDAHGYRQLGLTKKKVQKNVKIHRVLAILFVPNPDNLPAVNHKDGIKTNNSIDNLEWCTTKENIRHALINGLTKYESRLNQACLVAIRNLSNSGLTNQNIADIFGVTRRIISKANNGREYIKRPDKEYYPASWRPVPVHTIDENGTPIEYFPSTNEAARKLGIHDSYITAVLNGRQKTAKGHKFRRTLPTPPEDGK